MAHDKTSTQSYFAPTNEDSGVGSPVTGDDVTDGSPGAGKWLKSAYGNNAGNNNGYGGNYGQGDYSGGYGYSGNGNLIGQNTGGGGHSSPCREKGDKLKNQDVI